MSVITKTTVKSTRLKLVEARPHYQDMTDVELIEACQKQDEAAFSQLIKRHQRAVYAILYQLAPDWKNEASDLAQEVFIRVWRSIRTLRNPHSFRTWLNQIATNLFYDELRKRPRYLTVSLDQHFKPDDDEEATTWDIADSSSLPDEVRQRRELSEAIQDAISPLPRQFRTAIVLREFEGLSYEEIAALTKTEIGTVKSRIARARLKVQEKLSPVLQVQV